MTSPVFSRLKFGTTDRDFGVTLNKRVNEYFKSEGIERHGNSAMVFKTAFMLSLYIVPYVLIVTGVLRGTWALLPWAMVMGFGIAGIGLSVMHDANHGAYSGHSWLNDLIGYSLNLMGATSFNWKIQHNVLHHSYTNVFDEDEDISPRGALRLAPQSEWKPVHRFQHIYAWVLYGLMTIVWVVHKDFSRLNKYRRNGLLKAQKSTLLKEWAILLATKAIFIGYMVILPAMVTPLLWWQVLIGVLVMHYVAGFVLAIIFQPAHVIEGTEYPEADDNRCLENNWAVHQLLTTTNFANKSRLLSWYVGGLNFQIEHHLFPNVCHVHYRNISAIVQRTAADFNLPYKSYPTFWTALTAHGRQLRELGRKPVGKG